MERKQLQSLKRPVPLKRLPPPCTGILGERDPQDKTPPTQGFSVQGSKFIWKKKAWTKGFPAPQTLAEDVFPMP